MTLRESKGNFKNFHKPIRADGDILGQINKQKSGRVKPNY
jgi:hypothetical protein